VSAYGGSSKNLQDLKEVPLDCRGEAPEALILSHIFSRVYQALLGLVTFLTDFRLERDEA
jgi:hypothetical protein